MGCSTVLQSMGYACSSTCTPCHAALPTLPTTECTILDPVGCAYPHACAIRRCRRYPEQPQFFLNSTVSALGLDVVTNMLAWFNALPSARRAVVYGFTLLNEPGHLMVHPIGRPDIQLLPSNEPILEWLRASTEIYNRTVVLPAKAAGLTVPLLYLNVIETAFPGVDQAQVADTMAQAVATTVGLGGEDWAVKARHARVDNGFFRSPRSSPHVSRLLVVLA